MACKDEVIVKIGYTKVKVGLNNKLTEITLNWEKVPYADGYEIYRSEKEGSLGKRIRTVKKAATISCTDTTKKLKNGKKYFYTVRPYWSRAKKKVMGSSNQARVVCKRKK